MKIDVSSILGKPGSSLPIEALGDLGSVGEELGLCGPVTVGGVATSLGKDVYVQCRAEGETELVCSRCLSPFLKAFAVDCEGKFVDHATSAEEQETEVEIFPLEGTFCGLDEMIGHEIVLNLPMKPLCTDECKGLCPACGGNLNEGDCGCQKEEVGPSRFGRKLLEAFEERSKKNGRTEKTSISVQTRQTQGKLET
ncbi:MAG: YceD family protein [Bacillota bacterium]